VLLLSGDYWGVRASIAHSPPPEVLSRGNLQGWAQPSQMLSPVSFDPPSGSPSPSPPPSPPTHYECTRCEIGVLVTELCQGQFMYESLDSEWHEVHCLRCPDPLCPLCSPPPPPEPEPEPVPEPEPTMAPGGFMSADELKHDVFRGVPATSSLPPMRYQPNLVPNDRVVLRLFRVCVRLFSGCGV
jgi:hypothetical protein